MSRDRIDRKWIERNRIVGKFWTVFGSLILLLVFLRILGVL